ncbi:OLC1v1035825C1 [Oldenlandia corymbosa var. corymbosa]|uniref:OLC1v1035825C1 n=1 Tax=Oldenlandia corymbosa var. corymbosa TaxID=529605 RepID=A0AAV1CTX4_OLDCO|nr:OLC1v1035825C1 [Oldenlandia corymbosa var. corymbosa]
MKGNIPNKALLRDRFGNFWQVELGHEEEKTYFLGGWTRFVKQNYLEMGDMLVFKYDGIRIFDVKIFGSDSCDKRGVGKLIYKIKEEVEEEEPLGVVGEKCDHVHEEYPESDEAGEKEVQPDKDDKDETSEVEIMEKINQPVSSQSAEGAKGDPHLQRTRIQIDPFGMDIFKSGKVPKPKNPYFFTKVNKRRQSELFVPTKIINTYDLQLPKETLLLDSRGREWKTTLTIWRDGRSYYNGGWKELCKANLIGDNEHCICEFVTCEQRGLYIRVHVAPPQEKMEDIHRP